MIFIEIIYSFSPVSIIQTQRRVSSGTSQEDRIAQAHGPPQSSVDKCDQRKSLSCLQFLCQVG